MSDGPHLKSTTCHTLKHIKDPTKEEEMQDREQNGAHYLSERVIFVFDCLSLWQVVTHMHALQDFWGKKCLQALNFLLFFNSHICNTRMLSLRNGKTHGMEFSFSFRCGPLLLLTTWENIRCQKAPDFCVMFINSPCWRRQTIKNISPENYLLLMEKYGKMQRGGGGGGEKNCLRKRW